MRTSKEIAEDIRRLLAVSESPTIEAVTVNGWYACFDGTYCRIVWALSRPIVSVRLKRVESRARFEDLEIELNESESVEHVEALDKRHRAALRRE